MLKNFRDRLVSVRLMHDEREVKIALIIISVFLVVLVGNLLYLNYIFLQRPSQNITTTNAPSAIPIATQVPSIPTFAPTEIPRTVNSGVQTQTQTNPGVKDYFIPIGSGTNATDDWADVVGAQATADLGGYQNIKEIRFEVSINVPTANQWVSVRLFNTTDKHPVWYSEVIMNGGPSAYLISQPILYDSGQKTYVVQMKTQLKYMANLAQSRIHIILK